MEASPEDSTKVRRYGYEEMARDELCEMSCAPLKIGKAHCCWRGVVCVDAGEAALGMF